MGPRLGFAFVAVSWLALCSFADVSRRQRLPDDPVMRAGREASLAAQYCPGIRTDVDGFRTFEHAGGLTHADFYMRPLSPALDADLAGLRRALRGATDAPCARLWAAYGPEGSRARLLRAN